MRHYLYSPTVQSEYPIAILSQTLKVQDFVKYYLDPFSADKDSVICLELYAKPGVKKTPVKEIKEYLEQEIVPALVENGCSYILCDDGEYFKVLTGAKKVEAQLGYIMECLYGDFKVIYVPNVKTRFYDPDAWTAKADRAMNALIAHAEGSYVEPGEAVLKNVSYPKTYFEIQLALVNLLTRDADLTCDIEAFDLKHYLAGIGSISFAWDENSGVSFLVDYEPLAEKDENNHYGKQVRNEPVRALLKNFFETFKRKLIYHNISFDVTVLISQLFMKDLLDTEGLLYGMEMMLDNWDCTKLITYLATNSCGGNELGLKDQSQEFAGNYAEEDIKDIRKIAPDALLQYNLVDSCATWFTYNKNYPLMVQDQQEDFYKTIFKPATLDIVQMQLTGMPLNMATVKKVKVELQKDNDHALDRIRNSSIVKDLINLRAEEWIEEYNATRKVKRVTWEDAEKRFKLERETNPKEILIDFNPNSNPQLSRLLYDIIGLPVIERTKTGNPAADGDTLKALKNHTKDPAVINLLQAFEDYSAVNKILTSFIPAMEKAAKGPDGWHYLFGFFNLGGTVSGRLSSKEPNMQNLPAKGKYAKLIKSCFEAPPGWIFAGLDFASLEDRISALTTKDPNKLRVYLDGFDGHCLRAYAYFGDQMPDIELAPPEVPCYKANVGGTDVYFHADEDVEYLGQKMKGRELYELLACHGV